MVERSRARRGFDETFAQALLGRSDVAVLVVGQDLGVEWLSPAAQRLLGGASGPLPDLVETDSATIVASFLDRAARAAGQAVQTVCTVPVPGSTPRRVELVGRDLTGVPAIGGTVVVVHDVTGWAEREAEYRGRLTNDPLTGLGNRTSLMDRLKQAARSSPTTGRRAAVLYADIDGFKVVNDTFGHKVGDAILHTLGGRLQGAVGERGSVFRMGGDEFVALLDGVTEAEAAEAGEDVLAAVRAPIDLARATETVQFETSGAAGMTVALTVSMGVAMVDQERRVESLLAGADMAMYRAKAAGRDRIEFYSPELRDWAFQDENRALAEAVTTDFRTGLANTAAFESDHARLFALFAPSQQAYAVLLADIDHFHDYNSAYGYRRGNEALRRVATTLASALRQGDRAYRCGGEEFAALLPRTRLDGALVVAERVQAEVEALGLEHPTNPGGVVTVTIGVNEAGKSHAKPEDVFDSVNALLLHGKDSGRNRVVSPRDVPGECGET
jgi:diguanylate cyclase (GGDEF)-like protein